MLSRLRLIATEMTGALLEKELAFEVECVASGLLGGDLQVGARVVSGEIDAVLFFRDALSHPHDPDIRTMLKACDIHQVPLATNCATAEIVVRHLARRGVPSLSSRHPSVFSGRRFPWDPIITRIPEPERYGP
jgi:methylglyoxal synthase